MKANFKVEYTETKEMVLNTCRLYSVEKLGETYRMFTACGGVIILGIMLAYMNPADKTPMGIAILLGKFAVAMALAFVIGEILSRTIGRQMEITAAEGEGEEMYERRVRKWGKEPQVMVAFYEDHFETRIGKQQLKYMYDVIRKFMESEDLIGFKIAMKGGGKTLFAFPKDALWDNKTPEELFAFLMERCPKAKKEVKKVVIPERKQKGFNVAIDGPAGAGKSTIAKLVAKEKKYIYVDTGAMYRGLALYFLDNNVSPEDADAITTACANVELTIKYMDGEQKIFVNGTNVTSRLREEEVGNMASRTSAIPAVRAKLLELQRELARTSNVVMDGRDIGTCVLPNADVKVYLTASVETRAKRRYEELRAKGEDCDLDAICEDIKERDERDMTREISPLKQAEDAVLIDSSDMTIEEVVAAITKLCKK